LLDISIKITARVHKASEAAAVALGEAINITTDMVDASQLAWLTGYSIWLFVNDNILIFSESRQ